MFDLAMELKLQPRVGVNDQDDLGGVGASGCPKETRQSHKRAAGLVSCMEGRIACSHADLPGLGIRRPALEALGSTTL